MNKRPHNDKQKLDSVDQKRSKSTLTEADLFGDHEDELSDQVSEQSVSDEIELNIALKEIVSELLEHPSPNAAHQNKTPTKNHKNAEFGIALMNDILSAGLPETPLYQKILRRQKNMSHQSKNTTSPQVVWASPNTWNRLENEKAQEQERLEALETPNTKKRKKEHEEEVLARFEDEFVRTREGENQSSKKKHVRASLKITSPGRESRSLTELDHDGLIANNTPLKTMQGKTKNVGRAKRSLYFLDESDLSQAKKAKKSSQIQKPLYSQALDGALGSSNNIDEDLDLALVATQLSPSENNMTTYDQLGNALKQYQHAIKSQIEALTERLSEHNIDANDLTDQNKIDSVLQAISLSLLCEISELVACHTVELNEIMIYIKSIRFQEKSHQLFQSQALNTIQKTTDASEIFHKNIDAMISKYEQQLEKYLSFFSVKMNSDKLEQDTHQHLTEFLALGKPIDFSNNPAFFRRLIDAAMQSQLTPYEPGEDHLRWYKDAEVLKNNLVDTLQKLQPECFPPPVLAF